ncbi:MAG: DNA polymerase IV, partial [Gammaproteobacteria bacterium]
MPDIHQNSPWPRFIALMDMNAFFASIEQLDNPELRGKPVGVTNGKTGTCIITCSYESRAYGIHTGMRVKEAKQRCPGFIQVPARPERYAAVSTRIMLALQDITPDVEVFSVDEAFLDITRCQHYWNRSAETIGRMIKAIVHDVSGLPCSVGLSGDKTTAKYAAKLQKPDGLTIIPPWEARERLRNVPVTELCGINKGIGGFLARYGAFTCGDVAKLPVSVLADRFGPPGVRIWKMCQGEDPSEVETDVRPPKSMGHGKVMPPDTRDKDVIFMYLIHMAEKVGYRLRQHAMVAQKYFIGLRTKDGWIGSNNLKTTFPTNDSRPLIELSNRIVYDYWHGEGVFQVQITALDPRPEKGQFELFEETETRYHALNRVMDDINRRYGEFTLARACLLKRSDMPNVIAPAWKPYGHRQTIVPTVEKKKAEKIEPAPPPDES